MGGDSFHLFATPSQLLSSGNVTSDGDKSAANTQIIVRVKKHVSVRMHFHVCTYEPREHDNELETHYLYSLPVVHFDYVEVKTVYSFAWRDEVTPLLIKIPPDVHQNLKVSRRDRKRKERTNAVNSTLVSLSGFA